MENVDEWMNEWAGKVLVITTDVLDMRRLGRSHAVSVEVEVEVRLSQRIPPLRARPHVRPTCLLQLNQETVQQQFVWMCIPA